MRRKVSLALAACLTIAACEVSLEDMSKWKDLKDGERRIAAIVPDETRSHEIRVAAALLLVDIDQPFVLADALKQTEAASRTKIVAALAPSLIEMLGGKQEDQPKAKDALYLIGGYLDGEARTGAARAVIDWAVEDFPGRFALGQTTLAQVLPALGTASVPGLLKQLATGEAIPEVVKILAQFEAAAVHEQGAEALVTLIRTQGKKAPKEAWTHLTKLITPALTPFLLEKIADPSVDVNLKDRYFDHLVKCGGPEAAPGLAKLLADHDLRWVAAQDILQLEGLAGVKRVFASLPANDAYEASELYDEVHFFCMRRLPKIEGDAAAIQAALIAELKPKRPLPAALAAHCLELRGNKAALPALKKLAKVNKALTGWKDGKKAKLGAVAKAAMAAISARGD